MRLVNIGVCRHCIDVIMGAIESQITSLTIVYSTVYSGVDRRKHESSASLASVRGIHPEPVNSPHKWPVKRKMFPFDDVIMGYLIYLLSGAFSKFFLFKCRAYLNKYGHHKAVKHFMKYIPQPLHDCDNVCLFNCYQYKKMFKTSNNICWYFNTPILQVNKTRSYTV